MALDKLVDSTQLDADLTSVANAIRAKGGTSGQLSFPSGMTQAIANIPTGGGGGDGYHRPSAWGAYPLEFQQEKAKEDSQRTMEAIYLLYHHNADVYGDVASFAGFKAKITGGYVVERGHMVGSTFTVDNTTSVNSEFYYFESFSDSMPEYIVYRITPQVLNSTFSSFSFGCENTALSSIAQSCVETYGRTKLKTMTTIKTNKTEHIDIIAYGTTSSMSGAFSACTSLVCIECDGWDLSSTKAMDSMFSSCYRLQYIDCDDWDTSSLTNMGSMFSACYGLRNINCENWDVSSVTTMARLFSNCYCMDNLDLSKWNTSSLTDMQSLFYMCYCLSSLDISNFTISNVTNMTSIFQSCRSLTTLNLANLDARSCSSSTYMFGQVYQLIDLTFMTFYNSFDVSSASSLSHDSLMSIINNIATISASQTAKLGSKNLAKLTAEEKAIATNKGWTLA